MASFDLNFEHNIVILNEGFPTAGKLAKARISASPPINCAHANNRNKNISTQPFHQ